MEEEAESFLHKEQTKERDKASVTIAERKTIHKAAWGVTNYASQVTLKGFLNIKNCANFLLNSRS